MASPTETVLEFVKVWEGPGGFQEAVKQFFTPKTVWENHGMVTKTGIDEALTFYNGFGEQVDLASMQVEMLALAETDNKVLSERIDHMIDRSGKTVISVRLMGIIEVADGKITAWRDYFDTAALATG